MIEKSPVAMTPVHEESLKEYAGGWMTERKNTDAPVFLKVAFAIIGLFCTGYLIVYMNGEINHPERGQLVRQFNMSSKSADGLMLIVAALTFVYVCIVVA